MPKLTKRADGRYQMQVYLGVGEDGRKQYKTVYGKTQKETQQKAEELRVKLNKGIDISAQRDTFSAWCDRWLIIRRTEASTAQYDLSEARAEVLKERLGRFRLMDITAADLQQVINELAARNPRTGKPSAKKTLGDYKQTMRQIFRAAIEARAIDYNPAEYVRIPQNAPSEQRRAITDTERSWIENTPHRAQTAAMLMLYAGLRRGEVVALTWNDIDFDSGTITINKSVTYKGDEPRHIKAPKTEAGVRVVPMPRKLIEYLSDVPRTSLLVVTSVKGHQMTESAWKRMWESYMNVLNVVHGYSEEARKRFNPEKGGLPMVIQPFTPHCLRHTYCTMLYEAGVDPLVAKELMGHSDIKTTLGIYTHLSHTHKTANARLLDAYLDPKNEAEKDAE